MRDDPQTLEIQRAGIHFGVIWNGRMNHEHHHHDEHTCCHAPATATAPVSAAPAPKAGTKYTCPMHPEIVRDAPGSCPICGMALEPKTVTLKEKNPELEEMTRRFWWSAAITTPVLALMVSEFVPGQPLQRMLPHTSLNWILLA